MPVFILPETQPPPSGPQPMLTYHDNPHHLPSPSGQTPIYHQHQVEQTEVHPYRLSHVLHLIFGYVSVPIGVVEPKGPPEPVLLRAPQQQGEGKYKFLLRT